MLAKAATADADEVVIDLEDAVPTGQKDDARRNAVSALVSTDWGRTSLAVRVNGVGGAWCNEDLLALAGAERPPASVVVPKVEGAGDLAFVDRLLTGAESQAERTAPMGVQALIETAAGLARVDEIAGASDRLKALVVGYADLAASLGRRSDAVGAPELWLAVQDRVLVAARAHGLQAIDGPFLGVEVDADFRRAAAHAAALGFDGKWAIHPRQVEALNSEFTPAAEEVARAERVLAALADAVQERRGAVELDGEMIDEAGRLAAQRVLARARAAGGVA